MSGEEEKKCPLCVQEMDWTDQQLKPCQCGYQVCVWCWHHLMDMAEKDETEGRCPACRTPYDKDRIVGTVANCERVVVAKKDRKSKPQKVVKTTKPEARKDLSNVRVIQRKMAYIIGLPLSLADEDILQRKEYFGQYGKVTKVSLSRTAGGAIQQFVNDTCSVYITYSKEEEAIRCIQSVHGFGLDGRILRASFGTAKYCHAWLRNMPCTNPSCLYLHSVGAEEDSFGKDEEAAVHTRNRVNQIVGATQNLQRRVGNMLPPPLDIPCSSSSSTSTDKPIVRSTPKDIAQASVTSTSHLASSLSSGDKDGRNITCNKTFVDVIGQRTSQPERDGNVAEDRKITNLCSDFSSITIAKNHHQQTEYSNKTQHSVPYDNHSIAVRGNNDSREYSVKPFRESSEFSSGRTNIAPSDAYSVKGQCRLMSDSGRQVWPGSRSDAGEDLLYYDDQRSKGSDNLSQGSSLFSSSHPIRFSDSSDGYVQQQRENRSSSDLNGECSSAYNHYNEASIPYTCVNPLLIDGGNEMKFQASTEPDRNYSTGNLFSNEEIVEQLRRLDDDTVTNEDDIPALDAVENSIISNILSMDFDSCDESLTLPHNLAGLLDGTSGRHGSWNFRNSDESRFSFAKDDNSASQISDADSLFSNMGQVPRKYSSVPGSTDNKEQFMRGPPHHVPRAQSSVPPGFAVPSTKAPPGFSTFERPNHLTATSGSYSVKTSLPTNQNYAAAPPGGHSNTNFDYMDPAILGVDRSKATHTYNYPGLEMRPTSAPEPATYHQDEARQWLMMQQQQSSDQNNPSSQQKLRAYGRSDSFSSFGDSYSLSSGVGDHQHQNYNHPSSYSQFSQQQQTYGNGGNSHMSNGYGHNTISVLDDVESSRNEVVGGMVGDIQRSERLGLNYYSGYGGGDMRLQMPSNGNIYNRVYGL